MYGRLVRDICYLYHQLSAYRFIMPDLDYASDFPLEYWKLINRIDTGQWDRFIRGGILILLLAMIQDVIDGSGDCISCHAEDVKRELEQFIPEDEEILRLSEAVEHGLKLLTAESAVPDNRFSDDLDWAYNAFVRKYFIDGSA